MNTLFLAYYALGLTLIRQDGVLYAIHNNVQVPQMTSKHVG